MADAQSAPPPGPPPDNAVPPSLDQLIGTILPSKISDFGTNRARVSDIAKYFEVLSYYRILTFSSQHMIKTLVMLILFSANVKNMRLILLLMLPNN